MALNHFEKQVDKKTEVYDNYFRFYQEEMSRDYIQTL